MPRGATPGPTATEVGPSVAGRRCSARMRPRPSEMGSSPNHQGKGPPVLGRPLVPGDVPGRPEGPDGVAGEEGAVVGCTGMPGRTPGALGAPGAGTAVGAPGDGAPDEGVPAEGEGCAGAALFVGLLLERTARSTTPRASTSTIKPPRGTSDRVPGPPRSAIRNLAIVRSAGSLARKTTRVCLLS